MTLNIIDLEKIRKMPVVALCAIGAVLALSAYFIFYVPLIKEIGKKSQECKAIEERLQVARNAAEYARDRTVVLPQGESSGKLVLSGIFLDKEKPQAIINQAIVTAGDRIGGNVVKEIREDCVILSDGSRDFELRLAE